MVDFGNRIRRLRQSKNMTQQQLGDRLGLTKSVVSAYETDLRLPSYDVLIQIADIFSVTTDYLLGMNANMTVDISDLSESDYQLIISLVDRLRQKK